jgi:response regulator RpfG family c-di-GMP phosphodiesterase
LSVLVTIIDDNLTNLRVYVNVISHIPGITTKTFQSSAAGLAWCKETEPDLLVLDYHMPTPNGIEFIQEYRKMRPAAQTPIVMITGEQDREVRRKALDVGASDFLSKPADPVEFLARVRNLLGAVESRRLLERRTAVVSDASVHALQDATAHEAETIHLLMRAVEYKENQSGMHVVRMGQYAVLLARGLGLSAEDQRTLMLAAPMHDVGKVAIPEGVLLKPGTLTAAEWESVRQHPAVGYAILKSGTSVVHKAAAEIALNHHERWNGEGYPNGINGEAIPISARICAVADAFDAMLADRPFRRALAHEQAFDELHTRAGIFYDPGVIRVALGRRAEMLAVAAQFADNTAAA